MKSVLFFFKIIWLAIMLIFSHYAISYLFPPPFHNINIIFVVIVLSIMGWESGVSIWLTCLLHFFIELYSITPFGMILFPSTISVISIYILYMRIFTNLSWYSAMVLSSIAIVIYRILYISFFIILQFFQSEFNIVWTTLVISYIWELGLSSILAGIIVFILAKTSSRFKSEKVAV